MPPVVKNKESKKIRSFKNIIRKAEGYRNEAYKPVEAEKFYTIGYGHYGEDVKRRFAFNWRQRQNAKNFVDTFGLLPRPTLTDEEARTAAKAEFAYKEEAKQRVWQAFAVFGLLIFLIILCNFGRF